MRTGAIPSAALAIWIEAVAFAVATPAALAQTRTARDAATAYGARLNAKGLPAALNQSRVNSRIQNRIGGRLSLRVERYQLDATANPVASLQAAQTDRSRAAPIATLQQPDDTRD